MIPGRIERLSFYDLHNFARQHLRAITPLPLPICPYRRKTTAPKPGDHAADSLRTISALSLTVAIPLTDPALVGVSYPRAFPANDLW